MKKAGGIIALIAGIFGILAAAFTLLIGGVGSAFEADGAGTVIGLGWGGVLFSFLNIVFASILIGTKGKAAGILIIISSVFGAILGGTIVAIFMLLSLTGGIMGLFGNNKPETKNDPVPL